MLRRPRLAYWVSQQEIDYANQVETKEQTNDDLLDNHFSMPTLDQAIEDYDYDRAKESMKKTQVKNSSDSVKTNMGNLTALRVQNSDGYDLE